MQTCAIRSAAAVSGSFERQARDDDGPDSLISPAEQFEQQVFPLAGSYVPGDDLGTETEVDQCGTSIADHPARSCPQQTANRLPSGLALGVRCMTRFLVRARFTSRRPVPPPGIQRRVRGTRERYSSSAHPCGSDLVTALPGAGGRGSPAPYIQHILWLISDPMSERIFAFPAGLRWSLAELGPGDIVRAGAAPDVS